MAERWVRYRLTAELLSDAHLGSGSGGGGIDALIARDRHDRPVIWASHVEGVLRDAARRLRGDEDAGKFFGRAGGERQRAVFTSLHAEERSERNIWFSTSRKAFDNRAPKDDSLRVVEYAPKGTKLVGEVELPESELPMLQRLVQEVDALGSGRATGSGRVKLSLSEITTKSRAVGAAVGRLMLLLKNRDPLCITATATPDNLIPSLAFVPGRTLLGAMAAWLIAEGDSDTASLLTSGKVSVSDALPLPEAPVQLESAEVLPAPISLQSEKPKGATGDVPWWGQPTAPPPRLDAWSAEAEKKKQNGEKLKRPEDDLFVYRAKPSEAWTTFKPARRVRLRNGRPNPNQPDPMLFAIEQIVEETYFLAEVRGPIEALDKVSKKLAPVLEGRRWLRVGRAGAPVEVTELAWATDMSATDVTEPALLTLTSDLLVRDQYLRWCTTLDAAVLRELLGENDLHITKTDNGAPKIMQDSVMVRGFNGTSRLWRMPAAAIRRGSVFEISGAAVGKLVYRAACGQWLGERTNEGFGRFRVDAMLPGVVDQPLTSDEHTLNPDADEETIAATTHEWFRDHRGLAKPGGGEDRKPSLSQWFDLVAELKCNESSAFDRRLTPTTAGAKAWVHRDAKAILKKLKAVKADQRALHAHFFMRWLRAALRANQRQGAA